MRRFYLAATTLQLTHCARVTRAESTQSVGLTQFFNLYRHQLLVQLLVVACQTDNIDNRKQKQNI